MKRPGQLSRAFHFLWIYWQHLPAIWQTPSLQQLAQSEQHAAQLLAGAATADTAPATLAVKAPKSATWVKSFFISILLFDGFCLDSRLSKRRSATRPETIEPEERRRPLVAMGWEQPDELPFLPKSARQNRLETGGAVRPI